jgi:hypothetical protein
VEDTAAAEGWAISNRQSGTSRQMKMAEAPFGFQELKTDTVLLLGQIQWIRLVHSSLVKVWIRL